MAYNIQVIDSYVMDITLKAVRKWFLIVTFEHILNGIHVLYSSK